MEFVLTPSVDCRNKLASLHMACRSPDPSPSPTSSLQPLSKNPCLGEKSRVQKRQELVLPRQSVACVCIYVSVCVCMCKRVCMCVHTHVGIYKGVSRCLCVWIFVQVTIQPLLQVKAQNEVAVLLTAKLWHLLPFGKKSLFPCGLSVKIRRPRTCSVQEVTPSGRGNGGIWPQLWLHLAPHGVSAETERPRL